MEDLNGRPIGEWATAKNLGIKNFDFKNAAAFYPWIYWRRFRKYREEGYAFLEKVMEDIEPSYGYSVLAQIMANTQHKAAITTNFDNLVADALAICTHALPLVCGHESLTGFIRPNLQRPAAASAVERLTKEEGWWAWHLKAKAESDPAKAEAIYHDGLVDFPNSPELNGYYAIFLSDIRKNRDQAEKFFRKSLELDPNHPVTIANFALFMEKGQKFEEAERLYRKALKLAPKGANTTSNFAEFLWEQRKDYDEAERLFRKALEIEPTHVNNLCNFALFLCDVRKDYDEAERLYHKALEIDPENLVANGGLGHLMEFGRKNYTEADRLYRFVLELNPEHKYGQEEYARFLNEHPEFAK